MVTGRRAQKTLLRAIKADVTRDVRAAKRFRLHWRGLMAVFAGSTVAVLLFDHFGRFDLARPTTGTIVMVAFTIFAKRDLVWERWFWATIIVLVAFHAVAIASVRWGTRWVPASALAGALSIDFLAMLLVIDTVGELVGRRRRQ